MQCWENLKVKIIPSANHHLLLKIKLLYAYSHKQQKWKISERHNSINKNRDVLVLEQTLSAEDNTMVGMVTLRNHSVRFGAVQKDTLEGT